MLSRKAKALRKHVRNKIKCIKHSIKPYIRRRSAPDDEASATAYLNDLDRSRIRDIHIKDVGRYLSFIEKKKLTVKDENLSHFLDIEIVFVDD